MIQEIKELLELREQEIKDFEKIQINYRHNLLKLNDSISKIRDACEHTYKETGYNSFFKLKTSECVLCGGSKVEYGGGEDMINIVGLSSVIVLFLWLINDLTGYI